MLTRLKFPEHGIHLAIDSEVVAYVSKDQGELRGVPRTYTTVTFKNPAMEPLIILSSQDLDSLAAGKFHERIIDALFAV